MADLDPPWPLAFALAAQAIGLSDPNPRVGCVIVGTDGTVLGSGHTQHAGGAHAEIMALREARARGVDLSGADLRGATAWVTLEPCAHHGQTPPCCDALIAAGVGTVVIAVGDPDPRVNGRGAARLAAAGVEVRWAPPEIAARARTLNVGFFARLERGRPWVRLKIAASLDGRTALPNGRSQWITGLEARADGHAFRRRAGAVLTGIGTVRADDPRLDVRLVPTARQPLRAVIDARLETPPEAALFAPGGAVLLYADASVAHDPARAAALRARGAEIVPIARAAHGAGLDLAAVLDDLARRQVNEVHVEAGPRLNGALLAGGWVDEVLVYLAPTLLGRGQDMATLGPLGQIDEGIGLEIRSVEPVGADLRLIADVKNLPAARRD